MKGMAPPLKGLVFLASSLFCFIPFHWFTQKTFWTLEQRDNFAFLVRMIWIICYACVWRFPWHVQHVLTDLESLGDHIAGFDFQFCSACCCVLQLDTELSHQKCNLFTTHTHTHTDPSCGLLSPLAVLRIWLILCTKPKVSSWALLCSAELDSLDRATEVLFRALSWKRPRFGTRNWSQIGTRAIGLNLEHGPFLRLGWWLLFGGDVFLLLVFFFQDFFVVRFFFLW